jgi:hypothetical protein
LSLPQDVLQIRVTFMAENFLGLDTMCVEHGAVKDGGFMSTLTLVLVVRLGLGGRGAGCRRGEGVLTCTDLHGERGVYWGGKRKGGEGGGAAGSREQEERERERSLLTIK